MHQRVRSSRRDYDFYQRSGIRVGEAQTATQLGNTLPHSADPNPHTFRFQLDHLLVNSLAVIANGDQHTAVALADCDLAVLRSRVPEHVGQGLLDDAEDRRLQLWLEPGQV